MLAYRDFAPRQLSPPSLLKQATYEALEQTLAAANDWIGKNKVDVINVETVVLPNLWSPHATGPADHNVILQPGFAEAWNQFIRVWYRHQSGGGPA